MFAGSWPPPNFYFLFLSALLSFGSWAIAEEGLLEKSFARARGFTAAEVSSMHLQRIDCDQQIYDGHGRAINGAATIRATRITDRFIELSIQADFDWSLFGLGGYDVNVLAPDSQRQLLDYSAWKSGDPIRLSRRLIVGYETLGPPKQVLGLLSEIRVLEEGFPKVLIVKERIARTEVTPYYLICR
jgi:hypothetical protein